MQKEGEFSMNDLDPYLEENKMFVLGSDINNKHFRNNLKVWKEKEVYAD
jgi:hypothetical protein